MTHMDQGSRTRCSADFEDIAGDLLHAARMDDMERYCQHGSTSTYQHSVAVASYSLRLARALRIPCDERSLVRGCLLHDYFLYDWHDGSQAPDRWHGFTHPRHALANAERDFALNDIERDLIAHHMFPLVPIPPRCREGWIATLVDKACSLREVFVSNPYANLCPKEAAL